MEALDPEWYSRVWFLCRQDEREIKATGIFVRFGYDVIGKFCYPLFRARISAGKVASTSDTAGPGAVLAR
jgi:hypothetical protein